MANPLWRACRWANREENEAVRADSLFRIASVSKPITAVAVLKLVEEGSLDLDAAAFPLLSALPAPAGKTEDPRLGGITIRHLLEHSGGWDRDLSGDPMFLPGTIAQAMGVVSPPDVGTIIRYMRGQPLDFDPGSHYVYSNFGYAVLGRVIEAATGQSYEGYVKDAVLTPMGISRILQGRTLLVDRAQDEVKYYGYPGEPLASSVFPGGGNVPWEYGGFYLEAMDSHGAWIASVVDFSRFLVSVDGRDTHPDLLSAATTATMTARPSIPDWQGSPHWYGLGFEVRPSNGDANWYHTGSLPGTSTIFVRAYNGFTWVALFNSRPADAAREDCMTDVDDTLWTAVRQVTTWSEGDLFDLTAHRSLRVHHTCRTDLGRSSDGSGSDGRRRMRICSMQKPSIISNGILRSRPPIGGGLTCPTSKRRTVEVF